MTPGFRDPPLVHLTCLLFNDSDSVITVVPQSWRVLIDGNELQDSDVIDGNGPAPLRVGASGTRPGLSGRQKAGRILIFQASRWL